MTLGLNKTRKMSTPFVVVALAVTLTACSGGSASTSSGSFTPSELAALLSANGQHAAQGTPYTVGFINDEGGSVISDPEVREGAQAALDYANAYLGGIDGHPVRLDVCKDQATAASTAACANQMIGDKVPAVMMGLDANSGDAAATVLSHGVPWITDGAVSAPELSSPLSFSFTGGALAFVGGLMGYFAQRQEKNVAIFTVNVPAAVTLLQTAVGYLKSHGVDATLIKIPPGTPDITPQMQAAISQKPSVLLGVGDAGFCLSMMQAYRSSGTSIPIAMIGQCIDPSVTSAVSLAGVISPVASNPEGSNAEAKLYRAVMQKYATGVDIDGYATTGYTEALAFVRAMSGFTGPFTKSAIAAKLKMARNVVLPIAANVRFTCNGKQLPPFAAPCSSTVFVATLDSKGAPTDLVRVQPADILGG